MSMQRFYSPTDYAFEWTPPRKGFTFGWYTWDRGAGMKAALKARNDEAKRLTKLGYLVTKYSLKGQQITKGGVGTPYPEVDFTVTCYGFTANEQLDLLKELEKDTGTIVGSVGTHLIRANTKQV